MRRGKKPDSVIAVMSWGQRRRQRVWNLMGDAGMGISGIEGAALGPERLSGNDAEKWCDVVIIGGGPSGAACAITAASMGLRAVVIDRARPVLKPEPSESVPPSIEVLIQALGLWNRFLQEKFPRYTKIQRDKGLSTLPQGNGYHIQRSRFDGLLRQHACEIGVEWLSHTKARQLLRVEGRIAGVATDHGNVMAPMLVDASGRTHWLAKKLRLPIQALSPPLVAWREVGEGNRRGDATPRFVSSRDHWIWSAPDMDGYTTWTKVMQARRGAHAQDHQCAEVRAVTWERVMPTTVLGGLICGDAAATLDPASGQGIAFALWSGIGAGQTVARCVADPASAALHLAVYDDLQIRRHEWAAGVLRRLYEECGIKLFEADAFTARDIGSMPRAPIAN